MIRITDFQDSSLKIKSLSVQKGDAWCFIGNNQSGLERFVQLLSGKYTTSSGAEFVLPEDIAVLSFSSQQEIYEKEIENDESDFLDFQDAGTLAIEFITDVEEHHKLIDQFGFLPLLHRGYRQLSTGQSRKLLLLQAITSGSEWFVLESPYEGLDVQGRVELDRVLSLLHDQGKTILITVHNTSDIPPWLDMVGVFSGGELEQVVDRSKITEQSGILAENNPFRQLIQQSLASEKEIAQEILIELLEGSASYGPKKVFENLTFTISSGQHTLFTGKNGSGKSTLLQMITGDNQSCYSNALKLFGRHRGSGESIWEIKQRMGIVSSELHRNYRLSVSSLQVVLSGLYDSIGVYKKVPKQDMDRARWWLEKIDMIQYQRTSFRSLEYAQQRMLLIARAFIKMPDVLILDEPTQGLDEQSRYGLLEVLEKLVEQKNTTLLYVSHRTDEYREFFHQRISLDDYAVS